MHQYSLEKLRQAISVLGIEWLYNDKKYHNKMNNKKGLEKSNPFLLSSEILLVNLPAEGYYLRTSFSNIS